MAFPAYARAREQLGIILSIFDTRKEEIVFCDFAKKYPACIGVLSFKPSEAKTFMAVNVGIHHDDAVARRGFDKLVVEIMTETQKSGILRPEQARTAKQEREFPEKDRFIRFQLDGMAIPIEFPYIK